jgi:hypothetical protein
MGWTFIDHREPGLSHAEFFAGELLGSPEEGGVSRIIESAYLPSDRGSVFYGAVASNRPVEAEVWALIVLTQGRAGASFGWKAMDETMGPAEDSCPARILDLLSATDHPYARDWRRRCRERISRVAAVREGTAIEFSADFLTPSGPCRRFVAVDPAKGTFRAPHGGTYRLRGWKRFDFELAGREP